MRYTGSTVTVTVTVPQTRMLQIKRLLKHAVDGYECTVVQHPARLKPASPETAALWKAKKEAEIETIRTVASELNVLERNRKDSVVVLRTSLVYYLLKRFNALTIAQAFGWDHATVNACVRRYETLKHYADYEQASATVNQHLTQCSLADSRTARL